MAECTKLAESFSEYLLEQVRDKIDAGESNGYVTIYDASDVTLVSVDLNDPSFGAASSYANVSTIEADDTSLEGTADADGTADHYWAFDSDDNAVIGGTCSTDSEASCMVLNTLEIVEKADVIINSWTITLPYDD